MSEDLDKILSDLLSKFNPDQMSFGEILDLRMQYVSKIKRWAKEKALKCKIKKRIVCVDMDTPLEYKDEKDVNALFEENIEKEFGDDNT